MLFLVANLLLVNDYAPIWDPWEGANWWQWQNQPYNLPDYVYAWLSQAVGLQLFWWRLPAVLLLLGTLAVWYYWGKPIFGQLTTSYTLLVMASSFTLVGSAKMAGGDLWLFSSQVLTAVALLRYLKQNTWTWQLRLYLVLTLGMLSHPCSMLVFTLVLWAYLRWGHPQGKRLDGLWLWVLAPLGLLLDWQQAGFLFTYGQISYPWYLLWMLLGLLPWTGLLVASFADLVYKLRRKEEMGLILGGLLLASLTAQSLALTFVLALLIARQLTAFFHPNYPYQSLAKGFAVLHLLFSFFAITWCLLSAYNAFGATGFRMVMLIGAIYWIFTFIAIIGLYGKRRDLLLGGMAWGGLMAFCLFWIRAYPLLSERSLNASKMVIATEERMPKVATLVVDKELLERLPSLRGYAENRAWRLEEWEGEKPASSEEVGQVLYWRSEVEQGEQEWGASSQQWEGFWWSDGTWGKLGVWELR